MASMEAKLSVCAPVRLHGRLRAGGIAADDGGQRRIPPQRNPPRQPYQRKRTGADHGPTNFIHRSDYWSTDNAGQIH